MAVGIQKAETRPAALRLDADHVRYLAKFVGTEHKQFDLKTLACLLGGGEPGPLPMVMDDGSGQDAHEVLGSPVVYGCPGRPSSPRPGLRPPPKSPTRRQCGLAALTTGPCWTCEESWAGAGEASVRSSEVWGGETGLLSPMWSSRIWSDSVALTRVASPCTAPCSSSYVPAPLDLAACQAARASPERRSREPDAPPDSELGSSAPASSRRAAWPRGPCPGMVFSALEPLSVDMSAFVGALDSMPPSPETTPEACLSACPKRAPPDSRLERYLAQNPTVRPLRKRTPEGRLRDRRFRCGKLVRVGVAAIAMMHAERAQRLSDGFNGWV